MQRVFYPEPLDLRSYQRRFWHLPGQPSPAESDSGQSEDSARLLFGLCGVRKMWSLSLTIRNLLEDLDDHHGFWAGFEL